MLQLLIDIKQEIAYKSEEVWYKLWRYDASFNKYAATDEGRRKFIELFTINDNNFTRLFDKLNSIYDLPAVIYANGTEEWCRNGNRHRGNDLPAVIWRDGSKEWYQNGKCHRDNDNPAIIWKDRSKAWYQNGKCHRDNDNPAVIWHCGSKEWYWKGKRHRIGKPAVIYNDDIEEWWENGVKIR